MSLLHYDSKQLIFLTEYKSGIYPVWAVIECYGDVVHCTVISAVDDEIFLCVGFWRVNCYDESYIE